MQSPGCAGTGPAARTPFQSLAHLRIPTYSPDGNRWRDATLANVEYWLSLQLVVVRRNRRGLITCVQFLDALGANPLRATAHMGQHYSVKRRFSGKPVWEFKPFLPGAFPDADRFLRSIFRAVPLSCLKVVPIDSHPSYSPTHPTAA